MIIGRKELKPRDAPGHDVLNSLCMEASDFGIEGFHKSSMIVEDNKNRRE